MQSLAVEVEVVDIEMVGVATAVTALVGVTLISLVLVVAEMLVEMPVEWNLDTMLVEREWTKELEWEVMAETETQEVVWTRPLV